MLIYSDYYFLFVISVIVRLVIIAVVIIHFIVFIIIIIVILLIIVLIDVSLIAICVFHRVSVLCYQNEILLFVQLIGSQLLRFVALCVLWIALTLIALQIRDTFGQRATGPCDTGMRTVVNV